MEDSVAPKNTLILKVHFPWNIWKLIMFDPSMTVEEAINVITSKREDNEEAGGEGLFIPVWANKKASGWLDKQKPLDYYDLKNNDLVEFRPKERRVQVQGGRVDSPTRTVVVPDTAVIREIIPTMVRQMRRWDLVLFKEYPNKENVLSLDKNVHLLHLPIPHDAIFVVLINNDQGLSEEMSDEQVSEKCSLYVMLPTISGTLLKRGDKGLVLTWKKRHFELRRDKIFYFKNKTDRLPLNCVSVQNVNKVDNFEPFDATSKAAGLLNCISLDCPQRTYYLIVDGDDGRRWTSTLEKWMELKSFFGPQTYLSRLIERKASSADAIEVYQRRRANTVRQSLALQKDAMENAMREQAMQEADDQAEEGNKEENAPDLRNMNVLLRDGSTAQVFVDASWEVYDLVYHVGQCIGQENAHQLTILDQDDFRKVEVLDHQLPLNQQNLPNDATLILKCTGIAGEDDVDPFENHFLYVELPKIDGPLLLKTNQHDCYSEYHVVVRGNRIYYYPTASSASYVTFTPMFSIKGIKMSEEKECPGDRTFFVELKKLAADKELEFVAKTAQEAEIWCSTLSKWFKFFVETLTRKNKNALHKGIIQGMACDSVEKWIKESGANEEAEMPAPENE